jgi:hypothetical protein
MIIGEKKFSDGNEKSQFSFNSKDSDIKRGVIFKLLPGFKTTNNWNGKVFFGRFFWNNNFNHIDT